MTSEPATDLLALMRLFVIWAGTIWGLVTLQGVVLTLTALFTALQIYVLVRDKIWKPRKEKS
jgi:hypothetical protein